MGLLLINSVIPSSREKDWYSYSQLSSPWYHIFVINLTPTVLSTCQFYNFLSVTKVIELFFFDWYIIQSTIIYTLIDLYTFSSIFSIQCSSRWFNMLSVYNFNAGYLMWSVIRLDIGVMNFEISRLLSMCIWCLINRKSFINMKSSENFVPGWVIRNPWSTDDTVKCDLGQTYLTLEAWIGVFCKWSVWP